jgi:hypothetical protein
MASEYLKWKARDEKPAPPPRELTKKEKLLNWLHYHRLHLIVAAVLLWILGSMLWNILGIGQTKPDVIVAYIGRDALPEETAQALETALSAYADDRNGDGKAAVELRQYATNRSGDLETAIYYNYAADTTLLADITAGESYLFLVEDPAGVQRAYQIFAKPDGSPPEENDFEAMDKVYRWSDCPVLTDLDVDQAFWGDLYLGRRCFYEEKQAAEQQGNEALWDRLTEGATR